MEGFVVFEVKNGQFEQVSVVFEVIRAARDFKESLVRSGKKANILVIMTTVH